MTLPPGFRVLKPTYGLDRYLLLVMVLAAPAWVPLFFPGLFRSHEGLLAVYDVVDLHQALLQGRFTLGWHPALSDGGPWPFYLAGAPVLLGVHPVVAVKLVFGVSVLVAGLAVYALIRQLWGRRPALLAAIVYTYAPFFLATIYVRGALADALAYALVPLVLLQTYDALAGGWRALPWLALALAALIWTQWGLALVVLILVVAYLLWLAGTRRAWRALLVTLVTLAIGALAGLLLWAPVWIEGATSLRPPPNAAEHVVYPFQLLLPTWGWGISIPGPDDTLPLQVGVVPWGLAALGLVVMVATTHEAQPAGEPRPRTTIAFFLLAALAVIALVLPVSAPLWSILGPILAGGYPWQWLGLVALCLSVVAGAVVAAWHRPLAQLGPLAALIVAAVLASTGYLDLSFIDEGQIPAQHPVNAVLRDDIVLLDYTLAAKSLQGSADLPSVKAGDTIRLTLYWQALRPITKDYTVFTHIIDAQPRQWAGRDNPPVQGTRPTSSWVVGELIVDEYELVLDPRTPAGQVELEAGMYLPADGRRLVVRTRSGEDLRAVLGRLLVQ